VIIYRSRNSNNGHYKTIKNFNFLKGKQQLKAFMQIKQSSLDIHSAKERKSSEFVPELVIFLVSRLP
jgi:hypothetical protein